MTARTLPSAPATHQLWGGGFTAAPADALDALNRSLPVDHRLWPYDVRAADAWARALALAGVLSPGETADLRAGLERVTERLADGAAVGAPDEDVHTLVERLLYEEVGEVAGKLNTGRSRNDQVATDLRLWARDATAAIAAETRALGRTLVRGAEAHPDLVLPGYTHGQRAQPVRYGYVLLAHAWPLARDLERLAAVQEALGALPLGAGALAGSGVAVDRVFLQETLGFRTIAPNALDVTGDRDFVLELMFTVSLLATHISRLAAEVATWTSSEYGFVRLADAWCTGSSLMPQKRNPDVFELARAKAARTLGDLVGLLATLKGLPAGYAKDLQEDKAAVFDAVDTILLTLPAVRGAVDTLEPVAERMRAALDGTLLATDVADGLVKLGVPFREAHHLTGRLVRMAESEGVALTAVPPFLSRAVHPALPGVLAGLGSWDDSIERRATTGGSARTSLAEQGAALSARFQG